LQIPCIVLVQFLNFFADPLYLWSYEFINTQEHLIRW